MTGFENALSKQYGATTLDEYLMLADVDHVFSDAFEASITEMGQEFWNHYENLWKNTTERKL